MPCDLIRTTDPSAGEDRLPAGAGAGGARPAFRARRPGYFALRATVKWSIRSPVSAMPWTFRVV